MSTADQTVTRFRDLALPESLLKALDEVGYEAPSPIQAAAIPPLLAGRDLLGRAPTGTGKTAAFALPLIASIDVSSRSTQVLALAPTRELAIQVAEAFRRYAAHVRGFRVLPIYGGQEYGPQIAQLKRGVQVVVGTPGRVMDHMRKGTLRLDGLRTLVLDEADEMLRMGFIEEVEWILEQTPPERQLALFSATLPREIERIGRQHLREPAQVAVAAAMTTAATVRQRYWKVSGFHKLDALTRILEVEPFDGVLVFVRTRTATLELAEKLEARGYAAAALNGEMQQKQRERTVEQLRQGKLDILVATDVAARGLDVERISHVINFDIPYDTEAYIHRIGRTGRAGRTGEAILFVAPREQRMLATIERATRQQIERLKLPTAAAVNDQRVARFKQRITDTLAAGDLAFMASLVEQYQDEHNIPAREIAAALAMMALGDQPLLLEPDREERDRGRDRDRDRDRDRRRDRDAADGAGERRRTRQPRQQEIAMDMERFRVAVGHDHGVKPGNLVGAIANEAGIDGRHIGAIEIFADHSLIDLPTGMPREIFRGLKKTWVCGQQLAITRVSGKEAGSADSPARPDTRKSRRKDGGDSRAGRRQATAGKAPAGKAAKPGRKPRGGAPTTGKPTKKR